MRTGTLIGRTTLIVTAALALIVGALGWSGSVSAAEQAPTTVAAQQESGSAWLGVGVQDSNDGVQVVEVAAGSPADDAGLRVGDVIAQLDDTEIDTVETLLSALADYAPGDEVTVTTSYRGVETEHTVTLAERPADLETQPVEPDNGADQGLQLGMLDFLGLNLTLEAGGLRVNSIASDSPLAGSGLEEGDVITRIGGLSIGDLNSPRDLLQLLQQGGTLEVVIERDGEEQTLEVDLPSLGDAQLPEDFDFDFGMGGMMGGMGQHLRVLLGVEVTRTDAGLELTSLDADSPLADLGFEQGDVVTAINGTALADLNLGAVESILGALEETQTLTVTVLRDGEEQDIDVDLSALDLPDFAGMPFGMMDGMMDGMMGGMGQMIQNRLGVEVTWTDDGLELTSLDADSPLVDLGFEQGDVVTAINGTALADLNLGAVESILGTLEDTQTITVTVLRGGEEQDIDVDLSALDLSGMALPFMNSMPFQPGQAMPGMGMMQPPTQLGVQYRVLTADVAAEAGLDVEEGALIEQVYEGTPAAEAGLQEGDVVTAVDGEAVDAEHVLSDRLSDYEAGDTVTLTVLRDGDEQSIEVTLGARTNGLRFEFRNDFGRGNGGQQQGQGPRNGGQEPNPSAPDNDKGNGNGSQQPANSGASGQPA